MFLRALLTVILSGISAGCTSAGNEGTPDAGTPVACTLRNDTGGPGQYADTCVQPDWVTPYVGTYSSVKCRISINTPTGSAPTFALTVHSGDLAGEYELAYEGGAGIGNDSYYRFTTDATFTTTAKINFGVGKKVSDTEELGLGFTVQNLDSTPTFSATFQKTITSPFSNTLEECGALTKS